MRSGSANHLGKWAKHPAFRLSVIVGALAVAVAALGTANQKVKPPEETYTVQKGEKIPLKIDTTKAYVLLKPDASRESLAKATKPAKAVLRRFETLRAQTLLNLSRAEPAQQPRWAIIDTIDPAEPAPWDRDLAASVLYSSPFYITKDNKSLGISHLVYVKLKAADDKALLEAQARGLKVEIVGNSKLMPLWYTLACSKASVGNALQVANALAESKAFAYAEPDYLAGLAPLCTDDEYFAEQWGLKNTGQNGGTPGMDINVCGAWPTATGKGAKVALVDVGIQLDHPDLKANIAADSFDTITGLTSEIRGSHGTACAGIVGAVRGNAKLGVAGVAPDATILSVSDPIDNSVGSNQRIANGLVWAATHGADVISNSWGGNFLIGGAYIEDAIATALGSGRGGKGCVVVFAAGNSDGALDYPANTHPGILVVGAMAPSGERKSAAMPCDCPMVWGSSYGEKLDVVAPGVFIPTTDRTGTAGNDLTDYTHKFWGTSAAAPHAAGVAALILQVNPNLTQLQVVDIIEKNCKKVGSCGYGTAPSRPNGTWNMEMGYGLVDATACVNAAKATLPKN